MTPEDIRRRVERLAPRDGDTLVLRVPRDLSSDDIRAVDRAVLDYLAARNVNAEVWLVPDDADDVRLSDDAIRHIRWGRTTVASHVKHRITVYSSDLQDYLDAMTPAERAEFEALNAWTERLIAQRVERLFDERLRRLLLSGELAAGS